MCLYPSMPVFMCPFSSWIYKNLHLIKCVHVCEGTIGLTGSMNVLVQHKKCAHMCEEITSVWAEAQRRTSLVPQWRCHKNISLTVAWPYTYERRHTARTYTRGIGIVSSLLSSSEAPCNAIIARHAWSSGQTPENKRKEGPKKMFSLAKDSVTLKTIF